MPRPALVFQHAPWEGPGLIGEELAVVGVGVETRLIALQSALSDPLPALDEVAAVVVMGGPMNVDELDRYPGLELERVYLAAAVKAGVAVLGVCLGHQLLARALGAEVTLAGGREFGFSPVSLTDDGGHSPLAAIRGVPVLQWHGDVAGLPAGARRLAGTAVCPNQAFALGSALGLQFHVEVGEAVFAQWMGAGLLEEDLRRAGAPDVAAQARALYPGVEEAYREVVRGWIRGVSHGG